jgi:integrase
MAKKVHVGPYGIWRAGRPRFQPGPRERALGFDNCDLRHGPTGPWFTFEEAREWLLAKQVEIAAARGSGRKRRAIAAPLGRTVEDLWEAYTKSKVYRGAADEGLKGLAPATQTNYRYFIRPLHDELIWRAPLISISREMIANEEKGLYRRLVKRHGLSMANVCMAALSAAITWGLNNGWGRFQNGTVMSHPLRGIGFQKPPPRVRVASQIELQALIAASDATFADGVRLSAIGDAVAAAFYSGQRKSDILDLICEGDDGNRMKLRQSKTGARVSIPRAPNLNARLEKARERRAKLPVQAANMVINEKTGLRYVVKTFSMHFHLVRSAAAKGIMDGKATAEAAARGVNEPAWLVAPCATLATLTFADLRDTCVTWLARAGCELPEIAAITGHSMKSIYSILKHYLQIDEKLADSAIGKLLDYMDREGLAV